MKEGLNLYELRELGASSIVACIQADCKFYKIEILDDESVKLSRVICYDYDSLLVDFDVWNGKEWRNVETPYPFYKKDNEELFLEVIEEVKNIAELKKFVEYN